MNVPTIRMEPDEARVQLAEVRRALHRRADAEYTAIAEGLQAVADGALGILSLPEVMQAAGFDELGRPKLAIARADRRQVHFEWVNVGRGVAYFDTRQSGNGGETLMREVVFPEAPRHGKNGFHGRGFSLVPMIPPVVRNAVRFRDRDTFILWEVEGWADHPLRAIPDKDPYLLKHLAGDAYAILAEWDLTPLERMVMAGRRQMM